MKRLEAGVAALQLSALAEAATVTTGRSGDVEPAVTSAVPFRKELLALLWAVGAWRGLTAQTPVALALDEPLGARGAFPFEAAGDDEEAVETGPLPAVVTALQVTAGLPILLTAGQAEVPQLPAASLLGPAFRLGQAFVTSDALTALRPGPSAHARSAPVRRQVAPF